MDEFESFVKPRLHPILSDFCTELTSIQQSDVENAELLEAVLPRHQDWLKQHILQHQTHLQIPTKQVPNDYKILFEGEEDETEQIPESFKVIFVTCGNWDLLTQLPNECAGKGIPLDMQWYGSFLNIKDLYFQCYHQKGCGMTNMLEKLDIELAGRHHRGIDDCRNIASILLKLIQDHPLNQLPDCIGPLPMMKNT